MHRSINRRTFLKGTAALGVGAMVGFPTFLRGAQPQPVKVGGVWPLTGVLAAGGNSCMNGAKIAISEINAAGGIKALGGAKFELSIADLQSKADVAMAETERVIRAGANVLIGGYGTDMALAATQISAKYGIPHLIDAALSPEVTQRGLKNVFKLMGEPDPCGKAALRDLPRLSEITGVKPKTAAIISVDSLYGQNSAKATEKYLAEIIEILGVFRYPPGTKDLTVELTKIKAMKPDILFVVNYVPDGILLTRQMKTLDFNVMAIWGMTDAARGLTEFITGVGKLAEYQWNTNENMDFKNKGYWEASDKYKKVMGQNMPKDAAFAYTLMYILADALERAKTVQKEALTDALSKTNFKNHFLCGGPITWRKDGQCAIDFNTTAQILNGKLQNILPEKYQNAKPVFPAPKWSERPA